MTVVRWAWGHWVRGHWLWVAAIGIRVAAALVLAFGPATDTPEELDGWDANRFQQLATAPGRHWVDHAVEYPPGTVIIAEILAAGSAPDLHGTTANGVTAGSDPMSGVVVANRRLIALSLLVDLGLAAMLYRWAAPTTSLTYLGLGTLMVPMGLLRLDLWAAFAATAGLLFLRRQRAAGVAVAMTVGWTIKVFPALILPVALAVRSWRAAATSLALSLAATGAWVAYGGVDAIDQMLSLRDVTGWHLETVPGSIIALFSDEAPRLEADAYRIGSINENLVVAGRLATVGVVALVGWLAFRVPARHRDEAATLMMLASTAALIVTASLLSPQFLLWLSPLAALLVERRSDLRRTEVVATAGAMGLTSLVLGVFSPPGLDHPIAALGLLLRDGLLVVVIFSVTRRLRQLATSEGGPHRDRRPSRRAVPEQPGASI